MALCRKQLRANGGFHNILQESYKIYEWTKTMVPLSGFKKIFKLCYVCPDCLKGAFHRCCYLITAESQ